MGGPIKIGNVTIDTIGQLKVGSVNVQAAYVGSEQVFPTGTTTTTTTTTSTTTTTTTGGTPVGYTLAYSTIDGPTACSNYPTIDTNIYYAAPGSPLTPTTGVIIYIDGALTTPAPNGFYSNGTNYWNTGAGSGNLQNETPCP
jgi:hypothetical protein